MKTFDSLESGSAYLVELGWRRDLASVGLSTVSRAVHLAGWPLSIVTADPSRLAQMGSARVVAEFLGIASTTELPFSPANIVEAPYAVRVHDEHLLSSKRRRDLLAEVWRHVPNARVDLRSPRTELHAYATPVGVIWGGTVNVARFRPLDPHARPFVRSYVVPSRKARMMLDLAGVGSGSTVLDPFCGTASILIEASRLGARAYGSDIDPATVEGARANADAEDQPIDLAVRDALLGPHVDMLFDAVVTDLPYGRSASLHGNHLLELTSAWITTISERITAGGRLVAMAPTGQLPPSTAQLHCLGRYEERVHRSLTREIVVYQRLC